MSLLYQYRILDSLPVAYFRLGDTSGLVATDEIGSADGTYSDASILGAQALISDETDTAANLNGSTHIKFGSKIRDLLNGKQTVTVEFLIKPNSITGAEMIMSLPRYANDIAPNICSDPNTRDETSCLLPGSCSNTDYADKNACETAVETWTAAVCSDPSHTDQSSCEAAGTCSDPIHTDQAACETAGETWTPETWTPGSCSDPTFSDQSTCENAVHTWTHDNDWYPWPDWLGHHAFFQIYSNDGKIAVSASTSLYDGWFAESASTVLTPGVTAHVIAEVNFSTSRIEVYVNNSLVASANGSPESNTVIFNNVDIEAGYEDMVASTPRVTDSGYNISATMDDLSIYDKPLTSDERSSHYNEAVVVIPAIEHEFQLPYNSAPSSQTWVSIFTVELTTEMEFSKNRFRLEYDIDVFEDNDKRFGFKYKDDNSTTYLRFRCFYLDGKDRVPAQYKFRFPVRYETQLNTERQFLIPYHYKTVSPEDTLYRYNFLCKNSMIIYTRVEFKLPFRHDESLDVNLEYSFPYFIRTVNAGATDSDNSEIIPQGDGIYDYRITLPNIRVQEGDHIAAIDSGSTYSSFFAKFNIAYPEVFPASVILFDNYGVTITINWEGIDVQTLEFYLKDVDIDSSISLSAFREDNDEYVAMLNLWPNWSSFISTTSYDETGQVSPLTKDYSYLVELDSRQFKILPLQPESCCILRTTELCMLPAHQELNEALPEPPPGPEPELPDLEINEMLLILEEPRSNYMYSDSSRSVITSTHANASWDDITGMGSGQALEPGVNPFVDINPTVDLIADSLFKSTQDYTFNDYPINQLSELAAIATLQEATENWNEGSILTDFQFNPALRPRSSHMLGYYQDRVISDKQYEDNIDIYDSVNLPLLDMETIKLNNGNIMLLKNLQEDVYNGDGSPLTVSFQILNRNREILLEETVKIFDTIGSGYQAAHGTLLSDGNVMIVYSEEAREISFKIYSETGIEVLSETKVDDANFGVPPYIGITTTSSGGAVIVYGRENRLGYLKIYDVNGNELWAGVIPTHGGSGSNRQFYADPSLARCGDDSVVIFYTKYSTRYPMWNVVDTETHAFDGPRTMYSRASENPRAVTTLNKNVFISFNRISSNTIYGGMINSNGSTITRSAGGVNSGGDYYTDLVAINEGIYAGHTYMLNTYNGNLFLARFNEVGSYRVGIYIPKEVGTPKYKAINIFDGTPDIFIAYADLSGNVIHTIVGIEDYIINTYREYRRSTDAVVDRKQGYNLSMVNGHIFTTQLVKIERDISYSQGQPTLTEIILPWDYMYEDNTIILPDSTQLIDSNSLDNGIDISSIVKSEPYRSSPSDSDSDMLEIQ